MSQEVKQLLHSGENNPEAALTVSSNCSFLGPLDDVLPTTQPPGVCMRHTAGPTRSVFFMKTSS